MGCCWGWSLLFHQVGIYSSYHCHLVPVGGGGVVAVVVVVVVVIVVVIVVVVVCCGRGS